MFIILFFSLLLIFKTNIYCNAYNIYNIIISFLIMNLEKYKWKYRILLITTPNYVNKEYNNIKEKFEANLYKFHNKYVKKITKLIKMLPLK